MKRHGQPGPWEGRSGQQEDLLHLTPLNVEKLPSLGLGRGTLSKPSEAGCGGATP